MFKILLQVAVVAITISALIGQSEQTERIAQQEVLLKRLEAVNRPDASLLVDEWRHSYPTPSVDRLTELRVLVQRVKADPGSTGKYTAAAKQIELDKLGSMIESPFGRVVAEPGLPHQ